MKTIARAGAALTLLLAAASSSAAAAGLNGSLSSMRTQHGVALQESYTFLRTPEQVRALAEEGELELVPGNRDYVVDGQVTHPYARPEVRLFLERLGAQYRAETGRRLVVTSLVRPTAEQPANAHRLSVHPAGMAVDLRVPADPAHRGWLERTLLTLEKARVLDVTRERRPPHYHVAVFPDAYLAYVKERDAEASQVAAAARAAAAEREAAAARAAAVVATPVVMAAQTAGPSDESGVFLLIGLVLGIGAAVVARQRMVHGWVRAS